MKRRVAVYTALLTFVLSALALPVMTVERAAASDDTARSGGGPDSSIHIEAAWARPALAGGTTAVYLTVRNDGDQPVTLVGGHTAIADTVELHETVIVAAETGGPVGLAAPGAIMRMQRVASVEIAPGARLEMAPGGHHLMLIGVREALREGDDILLELLFEPGVTLEISVPVRALGGSSSHDHHHGGEHSHH